MQAESNLGRLRVTNADGDADRCGNFDEIFALGSRSFAIWTAAGQLVFDSGDDLERIIAEAVPEWFNCSDSGKRLDGQSADRGPEPETAAVGLVGERRYAFIAPERIGGVYVYDRERSDRAVVSAVHQASAISRSIGPRSANTTNCCRKSAPNRAI